MDPWIVNRYNRGQNKYKISAVRPHSFLIFEGEDNYSVSRYDFLFNPEFNFANAFVTTLSKEQRMDLYHQHPGEGLGCVTLPQILTIHMSISPDPTEFLQHFKTEEEQKND